MATASSAIQKLIQAGTKIVAVGRNYAAHAKELGNAVPKVAIVINLLLLLDLNLFLLFKKIWSLIETANNDQEPVLFLKPTSSYLGNGGTIEVPHPLDSLHHEVELAVVIGQKARDVPETTAMDYVGGFIFVKIILLLFSLKD